MLACVVSQRFWASLAGFGLALPGIAEAAPPQTSVLQAVDAAFRRGQEQFDRGLYLSAARTWTAAAVLLPETDEHAENRAGIYEYIAHAYHLALTIEPDESDLVEAITVLDNYTDAFALAHPNRKPSRKITDASDLFRQQLADLRSRPASPPSGAERPEQISTPQADETSLKPWVGLAVGGGVALSGGVAMLLVAVAGAARVSALEAEYNADCLPGDRTGRCGEVFSRGVASNRMQVTGLVGGTILLGSGAAMLTVSTRRRAQQLTLAPSLSPTSAGLVWKLKF